MALEVGPFKQPFNGFKIRSLLEAFDARNLCDLANAENDTQPPVCPLASRQ